MRRGLSRSVILGRAAIFSDEKDGGFRDSSRAIRLCGDGGDGREESTTELYTSLEMEEISDFL